MSTDDSWRTPQFRQSIVAKIDEALQRSGMATVKKGTEMENHVFQKAKTREEYLGFVARLILHVRELNQKKAGGAMPSSGPVQDPINALQNLARQGTGNTMLGGLPPPPGPQQPTAPNPLMQGMNPRPGLQQKLNPGMQTRPKKTDRKNGSAIEMKPEEIDGKDLVLDEADDNDSVLTAARKRTFSEMCREACGLLRAVNKKLNSKDEFHIFGDHVAMKLRSLKSEHAKNVAQFHINTILFEALTGKYDSPTPQVNSPSHDQPSPPGQLVNSYSSPQAQMLPSPQSNIVTSPANSISTQGGMNAPSPSTQNHAPYLPQENSPSASTQSQHPSKFLTQELPKPPLASGSNEFSNDLSNIYCMSYDDFIH